MINPFQPEALNVDARLTTCRSRVAFLGGLSTQRTLPAGSPDFGELSRAGGFRPAILDVIREQPIIP